MQLFFLIFPLLLLIFLAAGYYFFRIAFYPRVFSVDKTLSLELENGRLLEYADIMTWKREEIHIRSPYGYDLFGYFYPLEGSTQTVILTHGITVSLYASMKYMPIFRNRGFNVLIYDNRFHGRSGGEACTFGFYEKHDLKAVVDWVINRFGPDAVIGTHGESLGAAIALQHAAIDPRIAFAIPDCPFSDLDQLFRFRLRAEYHLPPFPLLPLSGWFTRLLLGFNYRDASPIQHICSVETPILFIHGDQDSYIPTSMSLDMYAQKKRGIRAIYLAKGAKHAEALIIDRSEYHRQVDQFLTSIGVIPTITPA
jgi:uncharacterized protein